MLIATNVHLYIAATGQARSGLRTSAHADALPIVLPSQWRRNGSKSGGGGLKLFIHKWCGCALYSSPCARVRVDTGFSKKGGVETAIREAGGGVRFMPDTKTGGDGGGGGGGLI